MSWDAMTPRARLAVVAIASVLMTLAYANQFASFNQATYLLDPLHRALPELYRRDWFVSETPPYLPVFGWVGQWLFLIDPEGPVAVLTAHVVTMVASYAALYWIVSTVSGAWRSFLLVAGFATITLGRSMGGHYLLVGYLQPSSISTLGWLIAIGAFARSRYLVCGITLALSGAMHTNFLVLGIGLFTLAAFARRDVSRRDHVKLLAPQLVVLACFVPLLLSAAGPSELAIRILVDFHAAHYDPERLVRWIPVVIGWQVAAYAARKLVPDVSREAHALWWFSLVSCAIVVGSALVMRFTPLESLTQIRWSRMAPFGQVVCQVLVAVALVRYAIAPSALSLVRRVAIGTAVVFAIIVTSRYTRQLPLWPAIIGSLGVAIVLVVPWPRVARSTLVALAVVTLLFTLWVSPHGRGLTTVPNGSVGEVALARWAREQTPVDTLFLTPPELGRFRLLARRAIVVDTKSPPLRPDLLVAWYRRLCATVRIAEAPTYQTLEVGYTKLTSAELIEVARSFGADYIIVRKPADSARTTIDMSSPPVFANDEFVVYRTAL